MKDVADNVFSIIKPTLLVRKAPLVLAGTPPDLPEHPYWQHVKTAQDNPKTWAIFHLTSYDNPYIDKADIDAERALYEARGDIDVFKREYLAEYCPGARRMIFPMLDKNVHVKPYDELMREIQYRPDTWNYYVAMDPGTASCFAVTLGAINNYSGQVRILDESYTTDQNEISIGQVWPQVHRKMLDICPDLSAWTIVYDEAATWAAVELLDRFDVNAWPTQKAKNRKQDGLSLIKDLLLNRGDILFSDRCKDLLREMHSYHLLDTGQPVKKEDHAIDTLRYMLGIANYTVKRSAFPALAQGPTPGQIDDPRRGFSPYEDMANMFGDLGGGYLDNDDGDYMDDDDY